MPRFVGVLLTLFVLIVVSPSAKAAEGTYDSNGVKIHYWVEGQGEPVVLVHGFSVNYQFQWVLPGIVKALTKNYQVIGLDCRGHGRSDKPHDAKLYGTQMVDDVVRLLDHLKIKKAHIVGYSMGGFITLHMLATHPERMLTATTGGAGWPKKVDTEFLDLLADSLEQGKGISPLIVRLTPAGRPKPTEERLKSINQLLTIFNDTKALAAAIRSLRDLAIPEGTLKDNQVATLALVGNQDPFKDGVDEMEGRLPRLEVVEIRGADHMNAFAKPEFTRELLQFLARHPAFQKSGK